MSLTSRITNLFFGSTKPQQEGSSLGLLDDGLQTAQDDFTCTRSGARSLDSKQIMAQEAGEEGSRAPYLHVSFECREQCYKADRRSA